MKQLLSVFIIAYAITACKVPEQSKSNNLDDLGDQYVKLALEIGQYDNDFIDAYYGPKKWEPITKKSGSLPYEELKWETTSLINQLSSVDDIGFTEIELLRYQFLNKQLQAMHTKLEMLSGKKYPFDVESLRLYDVVAPRTPFSYYDSLLQELDKQVPGEGNLAERYEEYSNQFIIPANKVDEVFKTAISEARSRVKANIDLPENESFDLEYVSDQPWSAYNWYKGNAHSVIQINTDYPIYIERAIDLACHEGYPGHHVFNVMLEKSLVKEKSWNEYMVYPLFSPQSFIAEGSAIYGIDVAFNADERLSFEREVLFPLAGLDPSTAEKYYTIQATRKDLKAAGIDIARSFLNKEIDSETAISYLTKYLQFSPSRAKQRLDYYIRYRSYVINYTLGEEFIRRNIEEDLGSEGDKWEKFNILLTTPRSASTL